MIINGKEYPFESPTHRMVGNERIELTQEQANQIALDWAFEYDKQQDEAQAPLNE